MLEKTLESSLDCKEIQPVNPKGNPSWNFHWKEYCWSWNSNTLATWWEDLTRLKRSWCWERLKSGGEGDDRGWDGWMASPTPWTWVWVSSGSWWWTGNPDMLSPRGCKKSDTTEWLNWMDIFTVSSCKQCTYRWNNFCEWAGGSIWREPPCLLHIATLL